MDPFLTFFMGIGAVMTLMMIISHGTKILTFLIKCTAVIILSPMMLFEMAKFNSSFLGSKGQTTM